MADQPTHVVELKAGVGEPTFVTFTLGQELAPLSIGKKGMWRLDAARVLDVHAFLYFDGHSLFMQSADDGAPVVADGARVAKTWTEVFAPCRIEIGGVELAFRSLTANEDETQANPPPMEARPMMGPPQRTQELGRAAMEPARVSVPSGAIPRAGGPPVQNTAAIRRTATSGIPQINASDRPFSQGAFVTQDEDSTRVHPLSMTQGGSKPRPAAGEPARPSSGRQPIADVPSVIIPAEPVYGGSGPYPPMSMNMAMQMQASQVGMQMRETGMQLQQMQQQMHQTGMNGQPGMYGGVPLTNIPMPQAHTEAKKDPIAEAIVQFKAASPPRKASIVLAPFVIVAAMYLLLVDDPQPQAKRGASSASASVSVALAASNRLPPGDPRYANDPRLVNPALPDDPRYAGTAAPNDPRYTGTAVPVDPRLAPPPNDPRLATGPGPAGTGAPLGTTGGVATAADPAQNVDAGALLPKGEKTLERQAIDALARGDRARAATLYVQLAQLYPQNRAFAEAARILRIGMTPLPEAPSP